MMLHTEAAAAVVHTMQIGARCGSEFAQKEVVGVSLQAAHAFFLLYAVRFKIDRCKFTERMLP